jgi:hypothetical protein
MKSVTFIAASLLVAGLNMSAQAADLSLDAKRMLSYGTTAVEVKVCDLPITEAEKTTMMTQLAKYADAQKDLTQDDFTETMKTVGAQIGANKDAICAQLAMQTVAQLLAEDEEGK